MTDAVLDAEDNAAMKTGRRGHCAQGARILELK